MTIEITPAFKKLGVQEKPMNCQRNGRNPKVERKLKPGMRAFEEEGVMDNIKGRKGDYIT